MLQAPATWKEKDSEEAEVDSETLSCRNASYPRSERTSRIFQVINIKIAAYME